jgi:omega-amidase
VEDLKIALCQLDLVWEDRVKNLQKILKIVINRASRVDLIVLPEMFSTGFSMNPESFAESLEGETIQELSKAAKKYNVAIAGSMMLKRDKKYYNSFVFVDDEGKIETYEKTYLFSLGSEDKHYTHGTKELIINLKSWKIKPQICYDLRFPESHRNRLKHGSYEYDLLLFVANWPEKRIHHWDALLKARAIENQAYCIGVNRVGTDPSGIYHDGSTSVYTANGDRLRKIKHKEQVIEVKLNADNLKLIRRQLPFLKDRKD